MKIFNVQPKTIAERIRERLYAGAPIGQGAVVWNDRGSSVKVFPETLTVRLTGGWLALRVEMETHQTGRQPVQTLFFLGGSDAQSGLRATTTLETPDPHGLLARWGEALQAAAWDGVLDVLHGAAVLKGQGQSALQAFWGGKDVLSIGVADEVSP